jgi:UDP-N-acetylglucosamine 1-carboxyvinyltransferase
MGVGMEETGSELRVHAEIGTPLQPINVVAGPAPQVSSDWIPTLVMALATHSTGTSHALDTMFADRLDFLQILIPLGLDTVDVHRVKYERRKSVLAKIVGRDRVTLLGGRVGRLHDLRGSAAVVLAGLLAENPIVLEDDVHLRRGYEDLPRSLNQLGGLAYDYGGEGDS